MPAATIQERDERRRVIARLLEERQIERQAELVELLRARGFTATQSSVSRDLRDMGAAKLKHGYRLPEQTRENGRSLEQVSEFVHEIRTAGSNLLVVTTAVGAAQRVAVTLDRIDWPEIVGTLSGDDTIFIATASAGEQRRLRSRLRQALRKANP